MDDLLIRELLDVCVSTDDEILANLDLEKGYDDEWPVQRVYALE